MTPDIARWADALPPIVPLYEVRLIRSGGSQPGHRGQRLYDLSFVSALSCHEAVKPLPEGTGDLYLDAMLDITATAAGLVDLFGTGQSAPLLTSSHSSLDMPGAYRIADAVRQGRLPRDGPAVGRKIGFTNHRMWESYDVKAPIWGYMYHSTVRQIADGGQVSLAGFPEPKIEPEIVFGLRGGSQPGDERCRTNGMHRVGRVRL